MPWFFQIRAYTITVHKQFDCKRKQFFGRCDLLYHPPLLSRRHLFNTTLLWKANILALSWGISTTFTYTFWTKVRVNCLICKIKYGTEDTTGFLWQTVVCSVQVLSFVVHCELQKMLQINILLWMFLLLVNKLKLLIWMYNIIFLFQYCLRNTCIYIWGLHKGFSSIIGSHIKVSNNASLFLVPMRTNSALRSGLFTNTEDIYHSAGAFSKMEDDVYIFKCIQIHPCLQRCSCKFTQRWTQHRSFSWSANEGVCWQSRDQP